MPHNLVPRRGPWLIGAGSAAALHAAVLVAMLDARPTATPLPPPASVVEVAFVAPEAHDAPPSVAAPLPPPPPAPPSQTPPPQTPPPQTPPSLPRVVLPTPTEARTPDAPEVAPEADVVETAAPMPPEVAVAVPTPAPSSLDASPAPPPSRTPPTRQERNYFAVISAHLNRRKTYPPEAKQARQQGVVVVRFRIDRDGHVLSADIKRGSGHALLDDATLELVRRVSPLPRIPRSIDRDELTLSLPIDYALTTD